MGASSIDSLPDLGLQSDDLAFGERLKALGSSAWAHLHDQQQPRLWRYAYARCGSRDLADEIVAQVFAEAVTSIGRFRPSGKPILAWLYTMTRNHLSNHLRRERRNEALPDSLPAESPAASVEARLDLDAALGQLKGEQREIIHLRFFAGYSTGEIAAIMKKREAAVYSLEARAIGSLR